MLNVHFDGCDKGDHCWDRLGSMSYNCEGFTIDVETERCRHCNAQRKREVRSKIISTVVSDTGWKAE